MSGVGLIDAIIAVGTWVGLAVTFIVKGIVLVFIMALISISLQSHRAIIRLGAAWGNAT